jgi:hypothetical protein
MNFRILLGGDKMSTINKVDSYDYKHNFPINKIGLILEKFI